MFLIKIELSIKIYMGEKNNYINKFNINFIKLILHLFLSIYILHKEKNSLK